MSTPARGRARVVIALEPAGTDETAIELARHLVLSGSPELVGVVVENVRLLEYARSRLAREIVPSGLERPLDAVLLERQMRAQSARVKAHFEAVAARLGLPHAFQIARGELVAELTGRTAEAEALIVSLSAAAGAAGTWVESGLRRLFAAPPRIVLFAREGLRRGGAIVTLVATEDPGGPALEAAARLAKQSAAPLAVLLTGAALEHRERIVPRIGAWLGERDVRLGDVVTLRHPDAAAIAQVARVCRARLVVLPARDSELVADLLRRSPSALLLVREE